MTKIIITQQFCGPPNSGNGGYVCGVLAKDIEGPTVAVLRARVPLDIDLELIADADGGALIMDEQGGLIGRGNAATLTLEVPPPPSLSQARQAMAAYVAHETRIHPICFTCGPDRAEGDGLRVFAGQIEGAAIGHVACVWTPHPAFADADGLTHTEVVWAALDCPGFFAWVAKEGRHGALLGTMTGEVIRRPRTGEDCIITAWPLVREGRKETAGVALFTADGELLARGHQVWIMGVPPAQAPAGS